MDFSTITERLSNSPLTALPLLFAAGVLGMKRAFAVVMIAVAEYYLVQMGQGYF